MTKKYTITEEENLNANITAESVATYGSTFINLGYDTEIDPLSKINTPEWEETINLGLDIALEQVKKGEVHDWNTVYERLKQKYACS